MNITENISTPVLKKCGVLVAGGGVAGIAAALAAKRAGADVLLVETSYILGGLATSGIVTIYLPLCDGEGKQVSFGIAEELLKISVQNFRESGKNPWLDGGSDEEKKNERYRVSFNPQMFALEAEKLLLKEGVEILYGSKICEVQKHIDKIKYIIIENKTGRFAVEVNSVVDATGDADICHFAGEDTKLFAPKNVLAAWYYHYCKDEVALNMLGFAEIPEDERTGNETPHLTETRFTGIDGFENSSMVQMAHTQILNDVLNKRKTDETYIPVTMPTIPQLRMTRRIVGVCTVDVSSEHTYEETSIGMISNWKRRGPVFELPFECLYGKKVKNLICAGRCISVTDLMWDVSRVIPPCAVTGEAAGTAAAMTDDFASFDVKQLQSILVKNGVILHEGEL